MFWFRWYTTLYILGIGIITVIVHCRNSVLTQPSIPGGFGHKRSCLKISVCESLSEANYFSPTVSAIDNYERHGKAGRVGWVEEGEYSQFCFCAHVLVEGLCSAGSYPWSKCFSFGLPSSNPTVCYGKWPICRWFTELERWGCIAVA